MKRILILAPHPDDECLLTAGVIYRAVQAGDRVTVCLVTHGDYQSEQHAAVRAAESRRVLARLGVQPDQICFLGYADTGMPYDRSFLRRLYAYPAGTVVPSRWGRTETWQSSLPAWFEGQTRPYTADAVRADLEQLLRKVEPDEIYVSAPGDCHGDHDALGRMTLETAAALIGPSGPQVYAYLVHADSEDQWPDRRSERFDVPDLPISHPLSGWMVEQRPLPEGFSAADKRDLIACYVSQNPDAYNGYLYAFAKQTELLFRLPA